MSGIIKQIQDNKKYESLTTEKLEDIIKDVFFNNLKEEEKQIREPYIKEIAPGLWEICNGYSVFWTGDGGKEEYEKAIKEEINKL